MIECCVHGKVIQVTLLESNALLGSIAVTFEEVESARKCVTSLHDRWFDARQITARLIEYQNPINTINNNHFNKTIDNFIDNEEVVDQFLNSLEYNNNNTDLTTFSTITNNKECTITNNNNNNNNNSNTTSSILNNLSFFYADDEINKNANIDTYSNTIIKINELVDEVSEDCTAVANETEDFLNSLL